MGQYGHQKMQNFLPYKPIYYEVNWWAYIGVIRIKDVLTILPAKTLPGKKVKESVQTYTTIIGLKWDRFGCFMAQNFAFTTKEEPYSDKIPF